MRFSVLTLFPEMFTPLSASMTGRAIDNGILELDVVNIRDFSTDKHKRTDDYTFGGGAGMVMMPQPIFGAMESVGAASKRVVYMSPRGRVLDEEKVREVASLDELVILCGHYEGVDQRVLDHYGAEEISVGDYVLTGGELPAMVLIDAVARLIPGVLSSRESAFDESIYSGLLEYPQYTQPRNYDGMEVPEVLLSGNHKAIDLWRFEQAVRLTAERRPELLEKFKKEHGELTKDQQKIMEKILAMM